MTMLELDGVTKAFGGLVAVDDVHLAVDSGSVHAMVGPNGAGKTTLFNIVSGFLPPDRGMVRLDGHDITHLPPHRRVPLGVVRTFQNIRLFAGMTVRENVLVGQHTRSDEGPAGFLRPWRRASEKALRRDVDRVIDLTGLGDYASRPARGLPYGVQKRVELARALSARPRMLLLDEPTAGMSDEESLDIIGRIAALRGEGVTVLLVEHDMNVVMQASDNVSVLDFGKLIAVGTPSEVQANPAVRSAYLGT